MFRIGSTCFKIDSNAIQNSDMADTLNRLVEFGISDESCNNWFADDTEVCTKKTKCMDCANGEDLGKKANCFSRNYHSYRLKSFEDISNTDGVKRSDTDIKASLIEALNTKGPVVCNMSHSDNVFSQDEFLQDPDSAEPRTAPKGLPGYPRRVLVWGQTMCLQPFNGDRLLRQGAETDLPNLLMELNSRVAAVSFLTKVR